jgi:hypothetical protein
MGGWSAALAGGPQDRRMTAQSETSSYARNITQPPSSCPTAHVKAIRDSLPEHFVWDERKSALLLLAMRQAEDVERLEADIAQRGVRLEGGRLNTALCELRQGRAALARILGQVAIPGSTRPAVVHARRAAEVRWQWVRQRATSA